jgi:hypothetical protein
LTARNAANILGTRIGRRETPLPCLDSSRSRLHGTGVSASNRFDPRMVPSAHSPRRVGMDVVNRHFLPKEAIAMLSVHRTQDRPFSRSMENKSG